MNPNYWGDIPLNKGLYYNNDKQIGRVLNCLINKKYNPNVVSINSESQSVTDGALIHLSAIIPQFFDKETEVFWFSGYPDTRFKDLGASLRNFLLNLWKKQDFKVIGENEYVGLSYELISKNDPHNYFDLNLAALSSRVDSCNMLLIIDIQNTSQLWHSEIKKLVEIFIKWVGKKGWAGAIIITGKHAILPIETTLRAPSDNINKLLDSYRIYSDTPEIINISDNDLAEAAQYIQPLILLGRPAHKQAINYVLAHYPGIKSDIEKILKNADAFWPLKNDNIKISPRLIEFSRVTPNGKYSSELDTIPNGAKILSFHGVDKLINQLTGIYDLDKMSVDATRLVDMFALAVGQKIKGSPCYKETINELINLIKTDSIGKNISNVSNSKSIICYTSQMLLTQPMEFEKEFFQVLESLTYTHAEMTIIVSNYSTESFYEASRWITNLGFIYGKIKKYSSLSKDEKMAEIYTKAVGYLKDLSPVDIRQWAKIRYDEAWHIADSGDLSKSAGHFINTAKVVVENISKEYIIDEEITIIATELLVAGLVLSPKNIIDDDLKHFLNKVLFKYGSTLNYISITENITKKFIILDSPGVSYNCKHDFVVISSHFDLHIALIVAAGVRKWLNRIPKVILIPENNSESLVHFFYDIDTIFIGGPDTPGLKGFINEYNEEIYRLYSLKILGGFAIHTNSSNHYPRMHVLSSDGLLGNYYAWQLFFSHRINKITKKERSMMDQVIIDLLVKPIISAAEGRIFNEFVDAIGRIVKRRKKETVTVIESLEGKKESEIIEIIPNIDTDVKTVLVEIANPSSLTKILDETMESLKSINLSPQKLLGIASFAYDATSLIHEKLISGSIVEIEVSIYVQGFREYRTRANSILINYKARSELDKRELDKLAEDIGKSFRNLSKIDFNNIG